MHAGRPSRPWLTALAVTMVVVPASCGPHGAIRGRPVSVSLHDFRISAATTNVAAGTVTFVVHNRAPATHEFVILRTNLPPDRLPIASDGLSVDEERVHHAGEISEVRAGTTATLALTLRPGRYVLICNLEGHYLGGMHHAIVVAAPPLGGGG